MTTQRRRTRGVPPLLPTVVVALLLGLLVLIAPSVGAWDVDVPEFEAPVEVPTGAPDQPLTEEHEEEAFPTPEAVEDDSREINPVWGQVVLGVLIALIVGAVVALVWIYLRSRRNLRPDEARTDLQVDAEIAPEEQIPVLARAATSAREALRTATDPTDAIIRAWLALEEAAASSGMRRRPADTPTELTIAVLARTQADPGATTGLLELYHRARFGTGVTTRADQDQAIEYLDTLARSWDQVRR